MSRLTPAQLTEAAQAALMSYEFACCWRSAGRAAREFIRDELGVKPADAQVATAVRIAQSGWAGIGARVRRQIEEQHACQSCGDDGYTRLAGRVLCGCCALAEQEEAQS